MKLQKIATIFSAVVLVLIFTGCENNPSVHLPDIPINNASAFVYKFDSELGGMVITDYKLQSPKVHIPNTLENEKVVSVDFRNVEKNLTHIIMPDSAKEFRFSDQIIGALQFVNIPNSMIEISGLAFCGCANLTSITVPDSVTKISELAFYKCPNIKATYKGKTYDYEHINDLYKAINGN